MILTHSKHPHPLQIFCEYSIPLPPPSSSPRDAPCHPLIQQQTAPIKRPQLFPLLFPLFLIFSSLLHLFLFLLFLLFYLPLSLPLLTLRCSHSHPAPTLSALSSLFFSNYSQFRSSSCISQALLSFDQRKKLSSHVTKQNLGDI